MLCQQAVLRSCSGKGTKKMLSSAAPWQETSSLCPTQRAAGKLLNLARFYWHGEVLVPLVYRRLLLRMAES